MPNDCRGFFGDSQRGKIKKVIIENGVTNIGAWAFTDCSLLTSITIPNSVTSIGTEAFRGCSNLTSITIPTSVTSIGDYTFSGCSSLTSINIPKPVTSIGNYVFNDCSNLTSITIPNSVTKIGKGAFCNCGNLISVTIPESVTSIGESAFFGCSNLISINIPEPITSIGRDVFYGCSNLTSITIPNSITSIGESAFQNCSSLTSIRIPNSTTSIGESAFAYCSSLTSITIPESVTSIGRHTFDGCYILESNFVNRSNCTISDVTLIDTEQVDGLLIKNNEVISCRKWGTSITIPNSVTNIKDGTFSSCSCLTSIIVEKGNKTYDSRNDCNAIIETKSNALIVGSENTIIPESVTSIGESAFSGRSGLTSITIPKSVMGIGESAFSGCANLISVTIPEFITNIGKYAFYNCSSLSSITIGNSVTSIGEYAFTNAKLRNIIIKAKTPPSYGKNAFNNHIYYHATLIVQEGSWDTYAYNYNWYQFINIREMTYNEANLTNSKAYMMKSATGGSYLFYDSVNDCVGELNETALDDTEENNTWMTVEVEGKHYVYNLGAKKFLVSGKTNTGYSLSDTPVSIDIEDGKDAIVVGKGKEFYMVINDKLNVLENLESQIATTSGIKEINAEANQPTIIYNVNGQIVSDNAKGLYIKNGKKYVK